MTTHGTPMTTFERNFYKPSAVCPKCGTSRPKPKYVPMDSSNYFFQLECWSRSVSQNFFGMFGESKVSYEDAKKAAGPEPDPDKHTVPDKVVNLCICGHTWEEKSE